MKRNFKIISAVVTLALVLLLGMTTVGAENALTGTPVSDTMTSPTAKPGTIPAAGTAEEQTAQSGTTTDDTALQNAFEAYQNAKQEERVTEMEEELKALVTSGKLTQEQADKILAYCKERMESRQADMPGMGMGRRGSNGRGMGCGFMNMNGGRQRNGKGNGFGMGLGGGRWNKP